jgi:hypothetical protein
MWPTEYMVHEHRKDMARIAAQMRLVREAATTHPRTTKRWGWQVFAMLRRPQPSQPVTAAQTQCALEGGTI